MNTREHPTLTWLLARAVRAQSVDNANQGDLHALAVHALTKAAKDGKGIMLPDGTTPKFTGRVKRERTMRGLRYRPDVTAELKDGRWMVFEVEVSSGKGAVYNEELAAAGIGGVEITIKHDDVWRAIEGARDAMYIPTLVGGALSRLLLTGTKENRRWLGAAVQERMELVA